MPAKEVTSGKYTELIPVVHKCGRQHFNFSTKFSLFQSSRHVWLSECIWLKCCMKSGLNTIECASVYSSLEMAALWQLMTVSRQKVEWMLFSVRLSRCSRHTQFFCWVTVFHCTHGDQFMQIIFSVECAADDLSVSATRENALRTKGAQQKKP